MQGLSSELFEVNYIAGIVNLFLLQVSVSGVAIAAVGVGSLQNREVRLAIYYTDVRHVEDSTDVRHVEGSTEVRAVQM